MQYRNFMGLRLLRRHLNNFHRCHRHHMVYSACHHVRCLSLSSRSRSQSQSQSPSPSPSRSSSSSSSSTSSSSSSSSSNFSSSSNLGKDNRRRISLRPLMFSKFSTKSTSKSETKATTTRTTANRRTTNELLDESANLSVIAKFKLMYKQYWYILIPVHVLTSLGWFGGFYYLSKSGVDIPSLLQYIPISDDTKESIQGFDMGHYAFAYLCYKLTTPLHYALTLGCTTIAIKYLVQRGYIKPMPTKSQLIKMYKEKKAAACASIKSANIAKGQNGKETRNQ